MESPKEKDTQNKHKKLGKLKKKVCEECGLRYNGNGLTSLCSKACRQKHRIKNANSKPTLRLSPSVNHYFRTQ